MLVVAFAQIGNQQNLGRKSALIDEAEATAKLVATES